MKRGAKRGGLLILALLATCVFAGLGVWQIDRRAWKLDLIARVDARINAPPVAPPLPSKWPLINDHDDSYRHVAVRGAFLNDRETLVQTLTELGAGYWVMTPLRTASGTILVNRGFVPPEKRLAAARKIGQVTGPVTVTGLMRMSEPAGTLLRSNNAAADRWYSRDVLAIGHKRGLSQLAPFFVDADDRPNPGGFPVGGLTVIKFRNVHLAYALTWFALALLSFAGAALVFRNDDKALVKLG